MSFRPPRTVHGNSSVRVPRSVCKIMNGFKYDEFGNRIGDSSDSSDAESIVENGHDATERFTPAPQPAQASPSSELRDGLPMTIDEGSTSDIVLFEDKKYYPDADEVFPGAQVSVHFTDTQDIEEPLLEPVKVHSFSIEGTEMPNLRYSLGHLSALMSTPALIRNVAIVGHLHHGKTTLMDLLIDSTVEDNTSYADSSTRDSATQSKSSRKRRTVLGRFRYTDTRKDEQQRGISIKSTPHSLLLEDSRGKSFVINTIDCPGHIDFQDEVTMALHACDGCILVVDAVEGPMMSTKLHIKLALQQKLPIAMVISKIDRLIHELKLPPTDAYLKLANIVDRVNAIIEQQARSYVELNLPDNDDTSFERLDPRKGNVLFASGKDKWCFSLESFARLYTTKSKNAMRSTDPVALGRRLWGDLYYECETRKFTAKTGNSMSANRSFVQFVLQPLYKIYAQALGESPEILRANLKKAGVGLTAKEASLNPLPLLQRVLAKFFQCEVSCSFVDLVTRNFPGPDSQSPRHLQRLAQLYPGAVDSKAFDIIRRCSSVGPLVVLVCKVYPSSDAKSCSALGKVLSGSIQSGQKVCVMGEGSGAIDQEDSTICTVSRLRVCQARYNFVVEGVSAGNWVLIDGIDEAFSIFCTLTEVGNAENEFCLRRTHFNSEPVIKLAIEPLQPAELPKMVHGLRCVDRTYPMLRTKVEESGEHILVGCGELYLDCAMHDLRETFAQVEIKVADPSVSFSETVVDSSLVRNFSETPNQKNRICLTAEPAEKGFAEFAESWKQESTANKECRKRLENILCSRFDWDKLSARSLWAFGPGTQGSNVLIDDTIPTKVDKGLINSIKDSVVQGFRWAAREGPLCDEPVRGVKFKVIDADLSLDPVQRSAGFMIPTVRRAAYASMLTANPRLMEPICLVEIQATKELRPAILNVLRRRRGMITDEGPVGGTPFTVFTASLPAIEQFGFETDLRCHTQGQAFCQSVFDHWSVVPGDPCDADVVLRPLTASRGVELARDFMVKTRLRKGLPEDIGIEKYFDSSEALNLFYSRRDELDEDDIE